LITSDCLIVMELHPERQDQCKGRSRKRNCARFILPLSRQ
jgi:hypothetical protein